MQFNPTEMTFTKSAQLAEIGIPGIDAPIQQFVRGQAEKLTLELFFDTTDSGMDAGATSVTTLTDQFYSLVKINSETHAPPVCQFAWNDPSFPGANLPGHLRPAEAAQLPLHCRKRLAEVHALHPARHSAARNAQRRAAGVQIARTAAQGAESAITRPHACYVIQRGDTLSGIAGKLYGTPADWRRLAEHNGITDPRRVAPGRILEAPPIWEQEDADCPRHLPVQSKSPARTAATAPSTFPLLKSASTAESSRATSYAT